MSEAFPDLSGRTILQVIPDLDAGGAERTVIEVAEALGVAGARAFVASRGGRMARDLEAAGGTLIEMNVATKNPIGMRGNAARLSALIREHAVDVIHARSRAPAWSALFAARKTAIPFVTTYHGAYSARTAPKRFYNRVMARGDRVIANSEWTANHVRSEHNVADGRLITIPRGVDVDAFDPATVTADAIASVRAEWSVLPDAREVILLLAGRLTRWKGQLAAITAFAALDDRIKQMARLVIIGDAQGRDAYVAELHRAIDDGQIQDRVHILRHTEDMPSAYAAADIIIAPSLRPEAFGRTAAEAAAIARPVIGIAHGGALETVVDGVTGRLVPVPQSDHDLKGLTSAMAELLQASPEQRAAMGAAGRAHILERFTKRGLQAATLTVYAELLNARS